MAVHLLRLVLVIGLVFTVGAPSHAAPVTDLQKIILGPSHGCGITQAGALRCFGNNAQGQLGIDRKLPFSYAIRALAVLPRGVTDVAIGHEHTCAVVDGGLQCWGSNEYGQLGLGRAGDPVKTPTKVSTLSGVATSVAAGWGTTCVILAPNGALQCWGRNDLGQVGIESRDPMVLQPTTVIPSGVTAVAVGGQHTCAVVDGGLQCWGFLLFKDDDFKTLRSPVSIIPAGQGVSAVAAGLHTCAIVKSSMQCWGRNFHNQVGVPEGARVAPKVPTVIIASGVLTMALNDENTCAVLKSGLQCWGANNQVQLGIPASSGSSTPMPLPVPGVPPAGIHGVAIGMHQVCVLTGAGGKPRDRLLQCTNRARLRDEFDENEPVPPDNPWRPFGTEDTHFAEPPPVLPRVARYGLWQGTIGPQEVMVLLAPSACDARYYDRQQLWAIPLTEKDRRQGTLWLEPQDEDKEATWTFTALSPDGLALTGDWGSHDGQRHVPIHLKLLTPMPSTEGDDGKSRYDCHVPSQAFDAPRIARARQERAVGKTDILFRNGAATHRYRQVSVLDAHILGFTLPDMGPVPGLRRALDDWEGESVSLFYECTLNMGARADMANTDFNRELAPQFWNSKLLVLRETYSNYCGGAHPSGGISGYMIWDLATDRRVDVWAWLKGVKQPGRIESKRLLDLVSSHYGRRDETGQDSCADAMQGEEYFEVYPSGRGMVFSPSLPHVIQACAEDIEIPWAKMRPFLGPVGRKALSGLLGIR